MIGASLLDLGKIALGAAFLAGLLKEKIKDFFNNQKFNLDGKDVGSFLGTLVGGALRDLFTKDEDEAPLLERFKKALRLGGEMAVYGGAAGFVAAGPIGLVVGAILAGAGGIIYSMLSTDEGDMAKQLTEEIQRMAKNAVPAMVGGGILGGLIFRTPQGIIAGAIIAGAFSIIKQAFDPAIIGDPKAEADRLMEASPKEMMKGFRIQTQNLMKSFQNMVGNFIADTFRSFVEMVIPDDSPSKQLMLDQIELGRPKPLSEEQLDQMNILEGQLSDVDKAIEYTKSFDYSKKMGGRNIIRDGKKIPYVQAIQDELNQKRNAILSEMSKIKNAAKVNAYGNQNNLIQDTNGELSSGGEVRLVGPQPLIKPVNSNEALIETASEGDSAIKKMIDYLLSLEGAGGSTVVGMNQSVAGESSPSFATSPVATSSKNKIGNRNIQQINLFDTIQTN
jgi:hypothetical protein